MKEKTANIRGKFNLTVILFCKQCKVS